MAVSIGASRLSAGVRVNIQHVTKQAITRGPKVAFRGARGAVLLLFGARAGIIGTPSLPDVPVLALGRDLLNRIYGCDQPAYGVGGGCRRACRPAYSTPRP